MPGGLGGGLIKDKQKTLKIKTPIGGNWGGAGWGGGGWAEGKEGCGHERRELGWVSGRVRGAWGVKRGKAEGRNAENGWKRKSDGGKGRGDNGSGMEEEKAEPRSYSFLPPQPPTSHPRSYPFSPDVLAGEATTHAASAVLRPSSGTTIAAATANARTATPAP
mgnify:CR=1 FL=1